MSTKKQVEEFNKWANFLTGDFDIERYSKDKKTIADTICANILDKLQSAFKWNELPDTIPQKWLEIMLMRNGYCVVSEVNGNLYALWGGLGGEYDEYYQPTICTVANPWLKLSKVYTIKDDKDAVLVSNDTLRRGVIPLIGKYAGLLAENTITIRIADIMARVTNILSASDESTIESAKEYLRQLEEGKLGIIEESPFLEDLKVQAGTAQAHTQITDLIELEQYLKASLYNELGLQANYNMKRETINSDEAQLDNDMIRPFMENMLAMRQEAAEHINAKYGTNISVEFDGVWKEKEIEQEAVIEEITDLEDEEVEDVSRETSESTDETEKTDPNDTEELKEPAENEEPEETPSVTINVNIENTDSVEVENKDGNNDEPENPDSIPDSRDSDESEEQENGGMADSDDK